MGEKKERARERESERVKTRKSNIRKLYANKVRKINNYSPCYEMTDSCHQQWILLVQMSVVWTSGRFSFLPTLGLRWKSLFKVLVLVSKKL